MYPELFTIPGLNYTVSSFGVMMSLGFLIGYWITYSRMEEKVLQFGAQRNNKNKLF